MTDTAISLSDWRTAPSSRSAFHRVAELMPTAPIAAGGAPRALPQAVSPLGDVDVPIPGGRSLDLEQTLAATHTDAIVVLHHGELVLERYFAGNGPETAHIVMSATKAVTGLVAAVLADEGRLDPEAEVPRYVPEVADGPYGGATVQALLDMRSGVELTPEQARDYALATGWEPTPADAPADMHGFLAGLRGAPGSPGGPFRYVSANFDLLGWVLERAASRSYAELVSTRLWGPMGAQTDAYVTTDARGAARATGGLCATAGDMARLGQLLLDGGGDAIPTAVIEDLRTGGDRRAWRDGEWGSSFSGISRDMSYRNGWYTVDGEADLLFAMGIHGQNLFIDRRREVVIAKLSSQQEAVDGRLIGLTHLLVGAIVRRLAEAG